MYTKICNFTFCSSDRRQKTKVQLLNFPAEANPNGGNGVSQAGPTASLKGKGENKGKHVYYSYTERHLWFLSLIFWCPVDYLHLEDGGQYEIQPQPQVICDTTDKEEPDSPLNPSRWWKKTSPRANQSLPALDQAAFPIFFQLSVIIIPSYLYPQDKSLCIRAQRDLTIPAKVHSKGDFSFSAGSHIPPVTGGSWSSGTEAQHCPLCPCPWSHTMLISHL